MQMERLKERNQETILNQTTYGELRFVCVLLLSIMLLRYFHSIGWILPFQASLVRLDENGGEQRKRNQAFETIPRRDRSLLMGETKRIKQ